jgi:hypothetical protein
MVRTSRIEENVKLLRFLNIKQKQKGYIFQGLKFCLTACYSLNWNDFMVWIAYFKNFDTRKFINKQKGPMLQGNHKYLAHHFNQRTANSFLNVPHKESYEELRERN